MNEDQFELMGQADDDVRGMLSPCALEAIRMGQADAIDEDWARLISIDQILWKS